MNNITGRNTTNKRVSNKRVSNKTSFVDRRKQEENMAFSEFFYDRRKHDSKGLAQTIKADLERTTKEQEKTNHRIRMAIPILIALVVVFFLKDIASPDQEKVDIKRKVVSETKLEMKVKSTTSSEKESESLAKNISKELSSLIEEEFLANVSVTPVNPDLLKSLDQMDLNGAVEKGAEIKKIDYYNKKVIVNKNKEKSTFQKGISHLLDETTSDASKYVESLDSEAKVRLNEVRSIALKKGDTIWSLAKRAYGDGTLYKRILAANPQINEKNARFLAQGTLIRVPL